MQLEKKLEKKLTQSIKKMGGISYKFLSSERGVPDRLLILPGGQIVFVELKTEKGVLSPLQEYQIGRIRDLGGKVHVVRGEKGLERFIHGLST